ncbi:hydroxymethylglutaryl-CoA reductase, degradative [Barrientosiimonas marina]|uniref:3-hydroxy-3-methylglutaryl coenzyme A reductase n=1 Tax=Lentibacillus kimchii TaxID=1542911 RepID=A0ABW2UWQ5_9BACI
METSRIPGFYNMTVDERRQLLASMDLIQDDDAAYLFAKQPLAVETADHMIENVIGTFPLPLGLGLNFLINGQDYVVPMAIEEPSVVASASHIAKIVRDAGGFTAESTGRVMTGQIQVIGCPDFAAARDAVLANKARLLKAADEAYPSLQKRGGGARDLDVRLLNEASDSSYNQMLVLHLYVDTRDAMGANMLNTMAESLAPVVEDLTAGKVYLRILSNYPENCLARARCVIPPEKLQTGNFSGEAVRDGVIHAYEFAASDPYRAVTHNKGIMNGIDPVVIASGNDWRAIEAGAHAHAARSGMYTSMSTWYTDEQGNLVGELELPMPVGTVGGSIRVHPMAKLAHKLLNVTLAAELAQVIVTVGLAQNLGALKALATEGIQKGHMALHSRSVAIAAGATGEMIDMISERLIEENDVRMGKAKELVADYQNEY